MRRNNHVIESMHPIKLYRKYKPPEKMDKKNTTKAESNLAKAPKTEEKSSQNNSKDSSSSRAGIAIVHSMMTKSTLK